MPHRTEPVLRLTDIGLRYRGSAHAVLEGVDLDIVEGEIVSILGLSGCGKSTLLRLVAGLIAPTSGNVAWRAGKAPRLGFVFQEPALMPWLTVAQNVAEPLRLGLSPTSGEIIRERVARALDLVGLGTHGAIWPGELSGGMKMRVSIARALASSSEFLLMDEPFAALDEYTREQLNDDLLRIRDEQKLTILFVTHSVQEAVFLSDRLAVLSGTPARVSQEQDIEWRGTDGSKVRDGASFAALCRDVRSRLIHHAAVQELET